MIFRIKVGTEMKLLKLMLLTFALIMTQSAFAQNRPVCQLGAVKDPKGVWHLRVPGDPKSFKGHECIPPQTGNRNVHFCTDGTYGGKPTAYLGPWPNTTCCIINPRDVSKPWNVNGYKRCPG